MSHKHKPVGGPLFSGMFALALALAGVGAYFLAQRFLHGIGAVSNMNDGYAWGIWITYDVLVGTALGCGGFAMALLVYVFNRGRYHPLVRSAVMTSLFGYTLAAVAVFIDIGRYWSMHHVLLPQYWNLSSALLEVALCIATYVAVLWIEFSPSFLEAAKGPGGAKGVNRVMFVFIAIGVLLPLMHQSSLGTVMVIAGTKLSPLWQSGLLPFYNVLTALTMGYAVVVFESYVSSVAFGRPFETPLLRKLSGVIPALLVVFLVVRWGDLLLRGALGSAFSGTAGLMFWVENALFVAPLAMLAPAEARGRGRTLCLASFLLLAAGTVFRFNYYLVGFDPGHGWRYFPSVPEIAITLGIVAVEVLAYLVFVKRLPVLPEIEHA